MFGKLTEVTIGEGDSALSELFDRVVMTMREGETCYVKSKVGGDGQRVGDATSGDSGIKFNMELRSFSRAAATSDLALDELLDRATHHKEAGTTLYRAGRVAFAVKRYQVALACACDSETRSSPSQPLLVACRHLAAVCHVNLAACYLKTGEYAAVEACAGRALLLDAGSVKARYRRALARSALHRYTDARADLQVALRAEPNNAALKLEFAKVNKRIHDERQVYRKMFHLET